MADHVLGQQEPEQQGNNTISGSMESVADHESLLADQQLELSPVREEDTDFLFGISKATEPRFGSSLVSR